MRRQGTCSYTYCRRALLDQTSRSRPHSRFFHDGPSRPRGLMRWALAFPRPMTTLGRPARPRRGVPDLALGSPSGQHWLADLYLGSGPCLRNREARCGKGPLELRETAEWLRSGGRVGWDMQPLRTVTRQASLTWSDRPSLPGPGSNTPCIGFRVKPDQDPGST